MKAEQLFRKTMPFCMAKFVLGGIMIGIMAVLLAIFAGIGWLFGDLGLVIGLCIWGGSRSAAESGGTALRPGGLHRYCR